MLMVLAAAATAANDDDDDGRSFIFYFFVCFNAVHVLFYTNKMMMLMPRWGNGFLRFFIVGVWLLLLTCGTHNQCVRGAIVVMNYKRHIILAYTHRERDTPHGIARESTD